MFMKYDIVYNMSTKVVYIIPSTSNLVAPEFLIGECVSDDMVIHNMRIGLITTSINVRLVNCVDL